MATGRTNQLTKQIGEYLVAAELGRLGLVAATFSGNMPDYDIIATDSACKSVPVQVKAITGNSWQLDLRRFVNIYLNGQEQIIGEPHTLPVDIIFVMVALSTYGQDRFYILSWTKLQELLISCHRAYLAKHGGIRPKRYDSYHCAINETHLLLFKDNWAAEFHGKHGLHLIMPHA